MNVELIKSHDSYNVIASLELPTLPTAGQHIALYRDDFGETLRFEILQACWCVLDIEGKNIQGTCIVREL